jgi:hypothetical protein
MNSQFRSLRFSKLHRPLNLPEHLKVTTLLADSHIGSPFAEFQPRRWGISFKQNFPKPPIKTSSPEARGLFHKCRESFDSVAGSTFC